MILLHPCKRRHIHAKSLFSTSDIPDTAKQRDHDTADDIERLFDEIVRVALEVESEGLAPAALNVGVAHD